MTKPDFGACEVRFLLPDIRLERRHVQPERSPFCTSYLGDTADLISRNGAGALHHARTDDTHHARVSELRPSRIYFVGLWEAKVQRSVMEGEAVGVIILVDVINTGPFLPPLSSWGSPRGLKGWMYADDSLRGADFHLAARPSS
jgi:hypothetical protein